MSTAASPFNYYRSINTQVSSTAKRFASPAVLALLQVLIISYAGYVAPNLPPAASQWLAHPAAKVALLSLILWSGNKDPATSIAVAVAFLSVMHYLGARDIHEAFEGPHTAIIPGCLNYTLYDLLDSFDSDPDKLYQAMVVAKVPGNVQVSEEMAGLIATYLINAGYKLKAGPCGPPQ
jgi:hypothetical protein